MNVAVMPRERAFSAAHNGAFCTEFALELGAERWFHNEPQMYDAMYALWIFPAGATGVVESTAGRARRSLKELQ